MRRRRSNIQQSTSLMLEIQQFCQCTLVKPSPPRRPPPCVRSLCPAQCSLLLGLNPKFVPYFRNNSIFYISINCKPHHDTVNGHGMETQELSSPSVCQGILSTGTPGRDFELCSLSFWTSPFRSKVIEILDVNYHLLCQTHSLFLFGNRGKIP